MQYRTKPVPNSGKETFCHAGRSGSKEVNKEGREGDELGDKEELKEVKVMQEVKTCIM